MKPKDVDPGALGRRVASRRIKLGLSQEALAATIGMKQQGIDAIEQGRVKRPRLLRELAHALNTSEEWLLWRRGSDEIATEPKRVPAGQEFREEFREEREEYDPEFDSHRDRPTTERDRPFPGALPQMMGRIGGGSTGVIITLELGELQSREEVSDWWHIPQAVLRGLARADAARTVAFVMDGDSMEPTIQRTDIVFIDTSRQQIEPDGIWALDYGLGRTLKRVAVERSDGGIRYVLKSDNKMYPDQAFAPDEVTVFGRYVGRFSVF